MTNLKTVITVPWRGNEASWRTLSGIQGQDEAYAKVPLIYRAVRFRCNSLIRVPYRIMEGDTEVDSYLFEESFPMRDLLWLTEAANLIHGAAYLLKLKNIFSRQKGLQWLNPSTIQSQLDYDHLLFWQQTPTGQRFPADGSFWTKEDFLYFRDFNPTDDLGPGVSAVAVALADATILKSVSSFLSNFFTADAMPVTMAIMPKGTPDPERERVENWFKKRLRGLRTAAVRVLGVSADVKLEKLTPELTTFEFDKVDAHAIQNVAWAFDTPKSLLMSDEAKYDTSGNDKRTFMDYTLIPRCHYYEMMLNPWLKQFGQRIEFDPQELPEMQEDEAKRGASLKAYTDAGVPLQVAMDILGVDVSPESQKILDKKFAEDAKPKQIPPQLIAYQNGQLPPAPPVPPPPVKADLEKWMRKSVSSFRATGKPFVEFESDAIDAGLKSIISASLRETKNEEEIKALFSEAESKGANNGH